ncbi:MAG: sigma-70 family RNA polymerase sigma factor [Planctomycetes bacterium]|nr:sigma-70 family RNA polymerase sigma factor [Planctomycetota bacterium]
MSSDRMEQVVQLLLTHQTRMRAYIRALVPERAGAEDVLQETNMVLWRKAAEFTPGTEFMAWALTAARFQALAWRQKQRRDRLVFDEALMNDLADAAGREAESHDDRAEALRGCLAKLPAAQRDLLAARYAADGSPEAIARQMGRPVGSIRQTLYRIRAALLACVEQTLERTEA